ncbi:MAG: S-layer homology domain-containing protein [Oscillospiraceae bacterium]
MAKRTNRLLSVLLTLVMLLALIPAVGVPALAAGVVSGVDVTGITAPVHGASPRFEGADPQTTAAVIADIGWFDQSGYRWMSASDKFVSGQKYTVYIYLTPASGYQFAAPKDFVFATINGKDAEVLNVYGRSEQRALLYTFTATDAVVYGVDVTGITAPVHGASPRFEGADPQTTAAVIADIGWFDQSGYRWMSASDKFVSGQKYTLYIYLAPASGNQFADPNDFVFATINGKDAEVLGVYGHSEQRALLYTFTAQAAPALSEVYVGIDAPVVGEKPATYGGTGTYDYTAGKATWSPADSVFQAGVAYTVTVAADIDYYGGVFDKNARVYVNGQEGTLVSGGGTKHILISYTFPPCGSSLPDAAVEITAPVVGEAPAQTGTVSEKAGYTVASVSWEPQHDKFQPGVAYSAVVTLEAKKDDTFFSPSAQAVVNGAAATVLSGAGTQQIRISYTFPALNSAPVIAAHPKAVDARPGDTVTFTVAATGENLHYQWWVVDAGVPAKIGTDSAVLILENVTISQYNNYDFWCVVSNTAGEAASNKAHLTVSNYVFPFIDVPENAWYYESVKGAHRMGLINGTTATTYSPDNNMTYAEVIKLAACMHQLYHEGVVTLGNGSPYWYSSYYSYCLENGIIPEKGSAAEPGYDTLLADAGKVVTRAQYALLFSRALPDSALAAVNDIPDGSLPDVDMTMSVYDQAIYKLYRAGIVNGTDTRGTFKPDSNIQRSEVAAILIRMMDESVRVGPPAMLGK